jgi:phytoene dehydrogenase-like protein
VERYDAVVIGAGHNGLVAAAYLARSGRRVLVLERRTEPGGGAATEEIRPGFRCPACAHDASLLSPSVVRDLELEREGLELIRLDPALVLAAPGGASLPLGRDPAETASAIAPRSRRDAERYPGFVRRAGELAEMVRRLAAAAPPRPGKLGVSAVFEWLRFGWSLRRIGREGGEALRALPMAIADFLEEWFETELLKGGLAACAVRGSFLGPRAQGTAHHFFYQQIGGEAFPSRTLVRGGMGRLGAALASAARRSGAEVRLGSEVTRIVVRDGAARGVVVAGGGEIAAGVVVSSADTRRTFLELLEPAHLEPSFVWQVKNRRFRGGAAKVNFALEGLPELPLSGGGSSWRGMVVISPELDYLERAFDAAKYGDLSPEPFLEISVPSLGDPTLAPPGHHVMSVLVQYAPYRLARGDWEERREELGDLVVETVERYARGFKQRILDRQVLTPLDLERRYGFTEGSFHHEEMALDQLYWMRPVPGWARYRTPIENLYLCGASAHPGGGITGIPGANAAREILKDLRRRGRARPSQSRM